MNNMILMCSSGGVRERAVVPALSDFGSAETGAVKESGHGRGTPRRGTGRSHRATLFFFFFFWLFLLFLFCHTFLLSPFQQSQLTLYRFNNYMIFIHLCCLSSVSSLTMAVTTTFLLKLIIYEIFIRQCLIHQYLSLHTSHSPNIAFHYIGVQKAQLP